MQDAKFGLNVHALEGVFNGIIFHHKSLSYNNFSLIFFIFSIYLFVFQCFETLSYISTVKTMVFDLCKELESA